MGCLKTNSYYRIGVFIISFLVIGTFLCQNMAWAGFSRAFCRSLGQSSERAGGLQYKLASSTKLDEKKITATSKILGSVLGKMYETIKTYKPGDPQQIELNSVNPNLRLIYNPAQKCFYLYSEKPRNGEGVVYRMSLDKVTRDSIIGDNKPFHEDTIGKFKTAIFSSTKEIKGRIVELKSPLEEIDLSNIPSNPGMPIDVKGIISKVVRLLFQYPELREEIEEIYVFGSIAESTASMHRSEKNYPSDIDLFVRFKNIPETGGRLISREKSFYDRITRLKRLIEDVHEEANDIFERTDIYIDIFSNAVIHPDIDTETDTSEWNIAVSFEDKSSERVDRVLIWKKGLDVPDADRSATTEDNEDNGGPGYLGTLLSILGPIIALIPGAVLAAAFFVCGHALAQESPDPDLLGNIPAITRDGSDIQHPPLVSLGQSKEQPQWVKDMDSALRQWTLRFGEKQSVYGGEASFDSNLGGLGALGVDYERWGMSGLVGFGNPILGELGNNLGGLGTIYLKRGNLLLSFKGGVVPYVPDTRTGFGLLGADYLLDKGWLSAHIYGRLGGGYRWLDGDITGSASGLLMDTGLSLTGELGNYRRVLVLDLGLGMPLVFSLDTPYTQVAAYEAQQRIFASPLSLGRVRLNYTEPFSWGELVLRGNVERGGFESELANRFARYGLGASLVRNNPFNIPFALVLGAGYEEVSPVYSPDTRGVFEANIGGEWRDLSGVVGLSIGPAVLPFAEVRYGVLKDLLLTGGLNRLPPVYGQGFYEGPFDPRQETIVSFGLRYTLGAGHEGIPFRTGSVLNNPYPGGEYGLQYVYGPIPMKVKQLERQFNEAFEKFERSIAAQVENAKNMGEVREIFRILTEKTYQHEENEIFYGLCWVRFWEAFYANQNITFYWIKDLRKLVVLSEGENIYSRFLSEMSPRDALERLLDKELEIPGQEELELLMDEFEGLIEAIGNYSKARGGWSKDLLDSIQNMSGKYMERLKKSSPDTNNGIFNYYVASRLFQILTEQQRDPGLSPLLKLIKFHVTIPPSSVEAPMVSVPDEGIVAGLADMVMDRQEGIMSKNLHKQIQGLLLLEFFVSRDPGKYPLAERQGDLIARLKEIVNRPYNRGVEGRAVPIVVTEESEYYMEIKAGLLALDILFQLEELVGFEEGEFLIEAYDGLPHGLKGKFKVGRIHPDSSSGGKDSSIPAVPLVPLVPGVLKRVNTGPNDEKIVERFVRETESAGEKKIVLALDTDIGDLKDPAISLLARLGRLQGNIIFVRAEGSKLKEKVDKIEGKDEMQILLVCKKGNLDRGCYGELEGTKNVSITAVNDENRIGTYVPILELLTLALKREREEDIDVRQTYRFLTGEELEEYELVKERRLLILTLSLPKAEPIKYDERYQLQSELLSKSA